MLCESSESEQQMGFLSLSRNVDEPKSALLLVLGMCQLHTQFLVSPTYALKTKLYFREKIVCC